MRRGGMDFQDILEKMPPMAIADLKAGDAIKFVNVSGGPHNVAFDEATVPADSKA